MESVSRNKRYLIKRIIDNDNTLTPSDLEKLKVIELLKMIEEQKIKLTEVINTKEEFKPRSLMSYIGCEDS